MNRFLRLRLIYVLSAVVLLIVALLILVPGGDKVSSGVKGTETKQAREDTIALDQFGIPESGLLVESGTVRAGQTLSHILSGLGLGNYKIHNIAEGMQEVFNPRRIRRGNNYFAYYSGNPEKELCHFVYEISDLEYLVVDIGDTLAVRMGEREVREVAREASGVINSSLWNALVENGINPELAIHMSRVLAWSVDFYRIEAGDRFRVLYSEKYTGDRPVGISHIEAIYFLHRGSEIEGFRFESDTLTGYYDIEGNNLRKVFLRAPLEFARITSRYSHSRLHPIHGDRRPHLGTDYAAPHGTPILAVGDGVVTRATYSGGNGNYVRIRHNSVYETQYLHMSRFASGIRPGARVSQGDVIGYVGSTGTATGPHVCFRFWKNGQQVDHLRLEFPSGDPLPEDYMDAFLERAHSLKSRLNRINISGLPS